MDRVPVYCTRLGLAVEELLHFLPLLLNIYTKHLVFTGHGQRAGVLRTPGAGRGAAQGRQHHRAAVECAVRSAAIVWVVRVHYCG